MAIISFEELGKSQIATDCYNGMLPEEEYKRAFRSHKKTAFASRLRTIGSFERNVRYEFWIDDSVAEYLEKVRQSVIYVDESNNPLEQATQQDAKVIIDKVKRHIDYIEFAQSFNQRIGSKALFK